MHFLSRPEKNEIDSSSVPHTLKDTLGNTGKHFGESHYSHLFFLSLIKYLLDSDQLAIT